MGKRGGQGRREVVDYRLSLHLGFAVGPADALTRIRIGEKVAWQGTATAPSSLTINKPELFGGEQKEGGVEGIAYYLPGKSDQVLPAGLAARLGLTSSTAPAYRNITSIWFVGELGSSAVGGGWGPGDTTYLPIEGGSVSRLVNQAASWAGFLWAKNSPFIQSTWATFKRIPKGFAPSLAAIGNDANPAHIIFEALTSTDFGKGDPASAVDTEGSFLDAAQTLFDEGFGLSLVWSGEGKIEDFIQEILDHIQAVLYVNPRNGKWTLKLLRDDYDLSGVPTFNMTNAELLSFQRKAWGEIVNEIVVSWTNPETEKQETVTVQNLAAIEAQGDTSSDTRDYYAVRNVALATKLAHRDLRQSSTPLAAAALEVPKQFWTLPPGSVVRFDWPQHDINGIVFRVMSVSRGSKKSKIRINLVEDIFSLGRPELPAAPGTNWEDPSIDPPELSASVAFTLPYPLASRTGLAGVEDGFLYPEAVTAFLSHHESAEVSGVDLYAEVVLPDGSARYEPLGTRQLAGRATLSSAFAAEAETVFLDTPGATTGRTPIEGGFAVIGAGLDDTSEIALVRARPEGGWLLQRGIFDTVPRPWATGTPIWFFDSADMVADKSRVRGAGEVARYKALTRTSRGALDLDSVSPVTATVSDRAHRPHRPANISVNGTSFGAVDISSADTITVTWSRRNRLAEDAVPPKWNDGDILPEAGQTTAIRLLATDGSVIKVWPEVPSTSFSFAKSTLGDNDAAYIEVLSTREGFASLQNWGAWLLDGVVNPGEPPEIPDVDDVPPPNQGGVETPRPLGANICPDPYFQDREFWNIAGSNWQSVSRAGSDIPAELETPKALVLSDQWYSGTTSQVVTSDLVVGLPRTGENLYFFARGKNTSPRSVTIGVEFVRSDLDVQVGERVILVLAAGENDALGIRVAPPSAADSVRFVIESEAGAWSGAAGLSNVRLVEYASAGALELEASLDAARDAINAARGELTENLSEANQTLEYAVRRLTEDARLGAQVSLLNRLSDPLFETGVDGWNAVGGAVLPVSGSPRALQAVWTIAATGRPASQYLQWPVRWNAVKGDFVQVGVEVGVLGVCAEIVIEAVWIDAAGDVLSVSEIAAGASGRLEGVVEAPTDCAEVTIRMAPVASEAGMGGLLVRRPLAASALPGQTSVDLFTPPENELVSRLARLERAVGNIAERARSLQVETRRGRASVRVVEQAVVAEEEARAQLEIDLNATLEGDYLTAAQVSQTYLAVAGLEDAFAGIDVSVNTRLAGVINTVDGLPADVLSEADANQTFVAFSNLEQSIANIDLSANAVFRQISQTVDGLPADVLSEAVADGRFLASADLNTALSAIDFTAYASFRNNTSRVVRSTSEPAAASYKEGDIWFNPTSGELRVHNGSVWAANSLATLTYANATFRTQSQVDTQIAQFNFSALSFFDELNSSVQVNATALAGLTDTSAQFSVVAQATGGEPAAIELISTEGGSAVNLVSQQVVIKTSSGGATKTALKAVDGNIIIPNTLLLGESGNITTPVVSGRFIRFGVIDDAMRFEAFDGSEYAISCNLSTGVFAVNGANLTNASVGAEKIPLREITAPNAAPTTTFGPWVAGEYAQLGNVRGWALQHLICPLDDVVGGARLDIDWDYDFSFQGKAAQFFTWWERVYLLPVSSGLPGYRQSTGLINSRLCEQGAGNTNNTAISPTAINANKWLAFPRGGSKQIVLPADAGSVAYRIILQLVLDRDEIDHSSGNQNGILNPNPPFQYAFESCDLRATALKR